MEEIWKPIPGYENHYEASNLGNIRKLPSKRIRKIDYSNIYPSILLSVKGKHKTYRVHRLIAKTFLPEIKGKNHVNHKDGNHKNNNIENLEWVSQKENNQHSYFILNNKNLVPQEIPWNKKMTPELVRLFDKLNKNGMSTEEIGNKYNINGSTIRKWLRELRKK